MRLWLSTHFDIFALSQGPILVAGQNFSASAGKDGGPQEGENRCECGGFMVETPQESPWSNGELKWYVHPIFQWIGLGENLWKFTGLSPILKEGKSMVSCNFSLKPIHWILVWAESIWKSLPAAFCATLVVAPSCSPCFAGRQEAKNTKCEGRRMLRWSGWSWVGDSQTFT